MQFYDALADVTYTGSDGHVLWNGGLRGGLGAIAGQYRARSEQVGQVRLSTWH